MTSNYNIRNATINDVDFIIDAIIEAEKSGSNKLSYSTIFNLTETEVREIIRSMLLEEIDGCEFSISNYIIAEKNNELAGTIGAWVEKKESPSFIVKSNLLGYYLPKESLKFALEESKIASELVIEHVIGALSLVVVYVNPNHRGKNLFKILTDEHIKKHHGIKELAIQVMANNTYAIRSYERYGFKKYIAKKCNDMKIMKYLPYYEKILLKKTLL